MSGGWRVGETVFLNSEPSGYTKYIFTASSDAIGTAAVPEPASLALVGLGMSGLGFGRRKRAA